MLRHRERSIYGLKYVFLYCAAIFLTQIYFLYTLPYDLYADEAQYWSWSKNIDWGYYSKPPMVAWLIAATTYACGDSQFCVKVGSPILHLLTSLVVYGIGHRLYNKKVGFWSALTYQTLPGTTVSAYLVSTDPLLLFFWALALYSFIRAVKDWHIKWWLMVGIACGLGMLSKYTMILFFVSMGFYFMSSRENRIYLISFKFWLAAVVAFLIYLPNFLWNMDHGFVSFLHTKDNADLKGLVLHWGKMFEFIGAQFGVFGPILFSVLFLSMSLFLPYVARRDQNKLLLTFIIPFFLLITVISLMSRAHANWAAPIYIAGTVLVVSLLVNFLESFWLKASLFIHIIAALLFYNFDNISSNINLGSSKNFDPFARIRGQKDFADKVKAELARHNDVFLLTTDRKTHATLLYYLRYPHGELPYIVKWNEDGRIDDHYDMTTDMKAHIGDNFLMVTRPYWIGDISNNFEVSNKITTISLSENENKPVEYDIYYMQNFKGYMK